MVNQLMTKRRLQQSIVQYALIILAIVMIGGYFGYMNYNEYQTARAAFNQESQTLNQLKVAADKASGDYNNLKKQMDQSNSGVNEAVEKIFPSSENFTALARDLDYYFLNTSTTANPMFLSDLRFNISRIEDGKDYAVLPFTINISGSEEGLKNFLDYVEKTGDLNDKSRLLKIASLNLNYQNASGENVASTGTSQITASLNMNAYFQKPLDTDLSKAKN